MNPAAFVTKLWKCAPSPESPIAFGLAPEDIEEFRNARKAIKRDNVVHVDRSDVLLELIDQYDLSTVRIGMVTFAPTAEKMGDKWLVGEFEADLLVINESGEIQVEEYGTNGHLLLECAEKGAAFLDALVIASCFLGDFDRDEEDNAAAIGQAQKCALAAGGDKYLDFYLVLLGCD